MTPPDEPVDIFERQEFPDPPAAGIDDLDLLVPEPTSDPTEKPRRLWLWALVGVAIGLVIAWVVFNQSPKPQMPANHPPTNAPAATPTPISAEEMAQLKAKVDADPTNKDNRLVYGVALFNDGQLDLAQEQWLEGTRLDPTDPGPWYNLGFLYLSLDPPQADEAEHAWKKVVELVPGTSMAQTASQHLARLNSTAAPATPAPSATP